MQCRGWQQWGISGATLTSVFTGRMYAVGRQLQLSVFWFDLATTGVKERDSVNVARGAVRLLSTVVTTQTIAFRRLYVGHPVQNTLCLIRARHPTLSDVLIALRKSSNWNWNWTWSPKPEFRYSWWFSLHIFSFSIHFLHKKCDRVANTGRTGRALLAASLVDQKTTWKSATRAVPELGN
jgi:hypothetical protein